MNIPAITGIIRRRILLNYRITPYLVEAILPRKFRPKLVYGYAIGGVCLIRLEAIRPKGLPSIIGFSSENSAHRFAVEWEDDHGALKEGVYVSRRDTDSRLNALAGGRVFPGVHHQSCFEVNDVDGKISIKVISHHKKEPLLDLCVSETNVFQETSVFGSIEEASGFFEAGCVGYSSRSDSCILDGLLLRVEDWCVAPLKVHSVRSAFFDDASIFPSDGIDFDCALLMRDIAHEWHSEPEMSVDVGENNHF